MTTRYDVSRVPLQGGYVAKQCPVRAQNDVLQPGEPVEVSPSLQRRFDRGNEFEAEIFERLRTAHPDAVFITGPDSAAREATTVAALAGDATLIIEGRLPADEAGRRVGKPDVLVRAASGGWRPVDVKHHMTLSTRDPERPGLDARCSDLGKLAFESGSVDEASDRRKHKSDMLQLAHYQRMLEAAGVAADDGRWGGIIGTEGCVTWHDLDEAIWRTPSANAKSKLRTTMEVYDFEFAFRLDIMAVAREHLEDPPTELLVVPVYVSECDSCPWFDCCMKVLEVGDGDVSLLPRVYWQEWKVHRDRGVVSRADLASLDYATAQIVAAGIDPRVVSGSFDSLSRAQLSKLEAVGISSRDDVATVDPLTASYYGAGLASLPEQIDLARAAVGPERIYRRRGVDEVVVPRGDVEVDVDMENVEDGCYLWGTYTTDCAGTGLVDEGYRAFVTWGPLGAGADIDNFRRFWTWLTRLRAAVEERGLVFRAYCYSGAENRFLRSQSFSAEMGAEVDAFIASDCWVDLLLVVRDQFITGYGNGLKVVAPRVGFDWSVDDAGGLDSMVRYDAAIEGDRDARTWLLTYNEEDVKATLALREWMDTLGRIAPMLGAADLASHPRR